MLHAAFSRGLGGVSRLQVQCLFSFGAYRSTSKQIAARECALLLLLLGEDLAAFVNVHPVARYLLWLVVFAYFIVGTVVDCTK